MMIERLLNQIQFLLKPDNPFCLFIPAWHTTWHNNILSAYYKAGIWGGWWGGNRLVGYLAFPWPKKAYNLVGVTIGIAKETV